MPVTKPIYPIAKEELESIVTKVESGMPVGQALEEKSKALKVSTTTLRNRIYGHEELQRRLDVAKHTQAAARAQTNIANLSAAREAYSLEAQADQKKSEAAPAPAPTPATSEQAVKPVENTATTATAGLSAWDTIAGALKDIKPNSVNEKIEDLLLDRKIEEKLKRERPVELVGSPRPSFSWAGFAMIGGLIVCLALFFWFLTKKNESSRIIEVEKIEKTPNELDEAWEHVNRTKRGRGL